MMKKNWLKLEQMSPLSDEMNQYFNSKEYKEMVKNNYHPENIYIDWDDIDDIPEEYKCDTRLS